MKTLIFIILKIFEIAAILAISAVILVIGDSLLMKAPEWVPWTLVGILLPLLGWLIVSIIHDKVFEVWIFKNKQWSESIYKKLKR